MYINDNSKELRMFFTHINCWNNSSKLPFRVEGENIANSTNANEGRLEVDQWGEKHPRCLIN